MESQENATTNQLELLVADITARRDEYLTLTREEADRYMALLIEKLDSTPEGHPFRRLALETLIEIACTTGFLPQSLELSDISERSEYPLAGGGFSDVWQANWRGMRVALKTSRPSIHVESLFVQKTLFREVILWRQLHHPNLLKFLGISKQYPPLIALVSPWLKNGDLCMYIKNHLLLSKKRILLLSQIASALAYLHNHSPPILHHDLRCANILVSDNEEAIVGDFGLSRIVQTQSGMLSSLKGGCVRWQAPELLFSEDGPKPSFGSDIWAFGMVVLEVFTGKLPYSDIACEGAVVIDIYHKRRPKRPVTRLLTDDLWTFMQECWADDPRRRIPAVDIVARLEGFASHWMSTHESRKRHHHRVVAADSQRSEVTMHMEPKRLAAIERGGDMESLERSHDVRITTSHDSETWGLIKVVVTGTDENIQRVVIELVKLAQFELLLHTRS